MSSKLSALTNLLLALSSVPTSAKGKMSTNSLTYWQGQALIGPMGPTKNENTMNLQASWRRDWKKAWSDQRSAVPDQELQQLAHLPLRLEQHRHRRRLHQLQNLYRPCQGGQQISELPTLLASNPEVGNFEINHRQDCLPINTLIVPMMTLFAFWSWSFISPRVLCSLEIEVEVDLLYLQGFCVH